MTLDQCSAIHGRAVRFGAAASASLGPSREAGHRPGQHRHRRTFLATQLLRHRVKTARHQGATRSACAGSTAWPSNGMTSCASDFGASLSNVSAGWSHACMARLNVPSKWAGAAAQQRERLQRILRSEVDVAPGGMECAYLEHHEIERAEAFADRAILRRETGVAAEENRVPLRMDDERRPQRRIAALEAAPGKVL